MPEGSGVFHGLVLTLAGAMGDVAAATAISPCRHTFSLLGTYQANDYYCALTARIGIDGHRHRPHFSRGGEDR